MPPVVGSSHATEEVPLVSAVTLKIRAWARPEVAAVVAESMLAFEPTWTIIWSGLFLEMNRVRVLWPEGLKPVLEYYAQLELGLS
jgi:hypothetical protein